MLKAILNKTLDVLYGPITTVYKRASVDYEHMVGPHTFVIHTCLQVIGRKRMMPEQMNGGVMIVDVPAVFKDFIDNASDSDRFIDNLESARQTCGEGESLLDAAIITRILLKGSNR